MSTLFQDHSQSDPVNDIIPAIIELKEKQGRLSNLTKFVSEIYQNQDEGQLFSLVDESFKLSNELQNFSQSMNAALGLTPQTSHEVTLKEVRKRILDQTSSSTNSSFMY
jgi:hypothetical protein